MSKGVSENSKKNLRAGYGFKDKEVARKAQKKSTEVKRQRKTFRACFEELLSGIHEFEIDGRIEQLTAEQIISLRQIENAMSGDIKAAEFIRDTVGEKPTDKVQISNISDEDIKGVEDLISEINAEEVKEDETS